MEQMIRLTRPGGVVGWHFTVGDILRKRRLLNKFHNRLWPLHWLYDVSTGGPWNLPVSEMKVYPARHAFSLFRTEASPELSICSVDGGAHQWMMLVAIKREEI